MKILILDDEDVRHREFDKRYLGHHLTHVRTYSEFKQVYGSGSDWDLVHLDHDLGSFGTGLDAPETYEDGWGCLVPYDGRDVVDFMLACDDLPRKVIVHSVNTVRAPVMVEMLRTRGADVSWIPFRIYRE